VTPTALRVSADSVAELLKFTVDCILGRRLGRGLPWECVSSRRGGVPGRPLLSKKQIQPDATELPSRGTDDNEGLFRNQTRTGARCFDERFDQVRLGPRIFAA
jgi:hypothetical protein